MLAFLEAIFAAVAGFFNYLGNQQLINAGKAEAANDANTAEQKNEEIAKQTVIDVNKYSNSTLADRLSKWKR